MDNNLSNEEQKIVAVLQERFDPQAIILVGSQVNGTATPKSDWDVFLFCGKWRIDEQIETDGIKIDANFAGWPADDQYLDAGFGPVSPIRVLYDQTDGRLEKLLENTRIAHDKGPLILQSDDCAHNFSSLGRNILKLQKHTSEPEVQFYYKGRFYELFLKVWFEQQNKWALSQHKP